MTTLYYKISLTLPEVVKMSVNMVPITEEDDHLYNYQIPADDCFAHLEVQCKTDVRGAVHFSITKTLQKLLESRHF